MSYCDRLHFIFTYHVTLGRRERKGKGKREREREIKRKREREKGRETVDCAVFATCQLENKLQIYLLDQSTHRNSKMIDGLFCSICAY